MDGTLDAVVIVSCLSRLSDGNIIPGVPALGSVTVPLPGWDIFNSKLTKVEETGFQATFG